MNTPEAAHPVLVERSEGIVTIRFNRPQALNAISVPMADAFLSAVKDIASDSSVRAIVLAGVGKGFMAGGDLQTLRANPVEGASALIESMNEAVLLLSRLDAPVIAKVHGVAAGAGLSLMLQADFVLAADDASFNLAYIHLGASCDVGASWFLPRVVGLRKALEIAMLSEALDAKQAQELGLVNRVVPVGDLDREVGALADRLARGPTLAYGAMKRLLHSAFHNSLEDSLIQEKATFVRCAATQDFRMGVEAFLEKKPTGFNGR